MPPQAAAHVRGMQNYGKAQAEANANQHKDRAGK
jgi:hypothetical protein